jgi:hypothetical protein
MVTPESFFPVPDSVMVPDKEVLRNMLPSVSLQKAETKK